MPRSYTPLTDKQLAAIAWADPALTTAKLANTLGVRYSRVWTARQRITRAGHWSCPIQWRDCRICGEPVASGPPPHDRTMHRICAHSSEADRARVARERWRLNHPDRDRQSKDRALARHKARWPTLPPEVRAAHLAKRHEADARDQPLTRKQAHQHGLVWTPEEDAVVLARLEDPAQDVALALGRTLWAVRARRITVCTRNLAQSA